MNKHNLLLVVLPYQLIDVVIIPIEFEVSNLIDIFTSIKDKLYFYYSDMGSVIC